MKELKLYDYQQKSVNAIRYKFKEGYKSPMFVLPTGGGKTVCFTYISKQSSLKGSNVLILVHRVELLKQTSSALDKFGVNHGLINPKFTPNYESKVQVASVQTLVNRLDKIPVPDLIIIDECHHAIAGSWKKVINHFDNALVLGVTATPVRGDGKGLGQDYGGVFDSIVSGPSIAELIERGFLVKPRVYAPPQKIDFSKVNIVRGDFDKKQVAKIMDKPTITGDAVDHYKKLCDGVPAVAFCSSVKHAIHVAEEFRNQGYKAYAVDGGMEDKERTRILDGLGNGSVDIVTSCDLISEGTDIPAIECAILLRPTQSESLYIQQVGRALRTSDNKDYAFILDHVGNTLVHGMPDMDRVYSLEGKKQNRRKKTDDEKNILAVQCERCYQVYSPQPVCPYCGHSRPVKEKKMVKVDGELIEVNPENEDYIKKKKKVEVWRANSLDDFLQIAKERGYKRGWAYQAWNRKKI